MYTHSMMRLSSSSPPLLLSSSPPLLHSCSPRICDFGLARTVSHQDSRITETQNVMSVFWTAPEILRNEDHTQKADVYSFGVVRVLCFVFRASCFVFTMKYEVYIKLFIRMVTMLQHDAN